MSAYAKAAVALAIVGAVLFCVWRIYTYGVEAGRDACIAERATHADIAQAETNRREEASASASDSMLDYLRANLPPAQEFTDETEHRVRIIYRDKAPAIAAVCVRPDGVQAELDAARDRANAAAGRLRNGADVAAPADPAAR